jgi:putative endonuclease
MRKHSRVFCVGDIAFHSMSFPFPKIFAYKKGMRNYYVYILSDHHRRLLYTGVTNQWERRLHEHRAKLNPQSYTARYDITNLVYFERHTWSGAANFREKEIKQMSLSERELLIRQFEAEERGCPPHLKNPYAPPGRQASKPLGP